MAVFMFRRVGAFLFAVLAGAPSVPRPAFTPAQMDSMQKVMLRVMDSVKVARAAVDHAPAHCGLRSTGLRFVLLACDSSAMSALVPPGRSSAFVRGGGGRFRMVRLMRILASRSGRSTSAFAYVTSGGEFSSTLEPMATMDTSGGGWALAHRHKSHGVQVLCRPLERGRWRAPLDTVVLTPHDLLLLGTRMADQFYVLALDAPALESSRDLQRANRRMRQVQEELYGETRAWSAAHPGPPKPRMLPGPLPASAGPFTE